MEKGYRVAVVGATGLVGRTILQVLEERQFPIDTLYLFSSQRSAGTTMPFRGETIIVEELNEANIQKPMDLALFSAGGHVSKQFAPMFRDLGAVVIDNSSAFRLEESVPLIVPEVNPDAILQHQGIIANPNCSTIQTVVPLGVLHRINRIKRIVYSTYQAVSGAGRGGLLALEKGIKGEPATHFTRPIAYNVIPQIDELLPSGYTKEELKMVEETRKILGDSSIQVTATTVRVPVRHGHAVSVNVELYYPFRLEAVKEKWRQVEGVVIHDDPDFPTPLDVEGKDTIHIGRIRRDFSVPNGINLWVVADNIRKGAATNAVQIAELLVRRGLL